MRITTSVIMMYLWITASASVIEGIGVAEDFGINSSIGVDSGLATAVQGLNDIEGGGISAESLVGLYSLGSGAVETLVGGLTAGPRIALGLGIPAEFVVFLFAPVPLLAGRMFIYALSGRDL